MTVTTTFRRVDIPAEHLLAVEFLCSNEWPFHARRRLSPDEASAIELISGDVDSHWVIVAGQVAGLVRLLDLGDVVDGSPLFDLRIAESFRGRGLGTVAVTWLTTHLFERFTALHRIEATTRTDNAAMQRVLAHCGYRVEGRLLEAWRNDDGSRADTVIYGVLRSDVRDRRPAAPQM
jgi:RimJ/RimL family protein N-acetyltransferase